jgi:hypothetical protein
MTRTGALASPKTESPSSVIPADAGTHGHGALANDGTATMGLGVRRDDVKCASEERRGEERRGEERRGEERRGEEMRGGDEGRRYVHGYKVGPSAGRSLRRKTTRHVSTRFNTPPLPPIRHPSESWGIPVGGQVSGVKSQRSLDDEDGGGALPKR